MLEAVVGAGQRQQVDVPVADVGQVRADGRNAIDAHHAHLAGDLRDRHVGQATLHVLEQEDRLVLEGDQAVLTEGIGGYDVVRVTRVEVKLVSQRVVVLKCQYVRRSQPVLAFYDPKPVLVVGGLVAVGNRLK